MSVTADEVRRIAELARLRAAPGEVERLTREMNAILGHVDALSEADVSEVDGDGRALPPAARNPGAEPDPLPADAPARMAPEWRDGFFLVPRLPALEEGT